MNHTDRTRRMPEGGYQTLQELLIAWLTSIMTAVLALFGKDGNDLLAAGDKQAETDAPGLQAGRSDRSIVPTGAVTAIQGQLNKLSNSRRLGLLRETRERLLAKIKDTRRTIKKTPKAERVLFASYLQLLDEIDTKSRLLYDHAERAAEELKRHNVPRIESEIARLEAQLQRSPSGRTSDTERTIEARRALLRTLEVFAARLGSAEAQLGYLVATLELNHLRIIEISAHTMSATPESIASMTTRTEELTDQLGVLDEFLRNPNDIG